MIYFDENKKAYADEIPNYIATIDDTTWEQYAGTDKWDIVNGVFTPTVSLQSLTRLAQIEVELNQTDIDYTAVLNTPVLYSNGHTYKPIFINDYVLLIASGMSYEIWSDDELYSETMDTAAITSLCLFLKGIAEPAYQTRKANRKALIEEKATLNC